MSRISPQIRLVAIIGVIAALGLFFGMSMLGGAKTPAVKKIIPLSQRHLGGTTSKAALGAPTLKPPAVKAPAVSKPAAEAKAKPAAKAKVPAAKPKAAVKPSASLTPPAQKKPRVRKPVVVPTGLAQVKRALETHPVVIVFLYNPNSEVDATAGGEAQAGAAAVGVGFVPVNVLNARAAQTLTEQFGVVSDPAVLVFRRPLTLSRQLLGFADRETVAQAAQDANPTAILRNAAQPK
ncbi:MAG: hypothetical protein QOE36_1162 [Gaiellaceae bacterium]|nr:hypothetical protein [Gaiellaceae bacterium]